MSGLRIGLLFDFPQADRGESFETAVRLGLSEVNGLDAGAIELVHEHARGLPGGSEAEMVAGFETIEQTGVALVIGPSISDNGVVVRDLADRAGLACINYTGGERTRSAWMFHYQIGSLEEEPPVLARRLAQRGLSRPAVVRDASIVGERYLGCFRWAAPGNGLTVAAATAVSPLSDDLSTAVATVREHEPDSIVYLGLGAASHALAEALAAASWDVPVVANSALMFGYARPDWRDGWAGWEYLDGIADDNERRAALARRDRRSAAGPIGCAAFDMGRLAGEAIVRADRTDRAGLRDGLEQVKQLPAASGREGTRMGFGVWDHAALKGEYLVLREWRDGRTVQVDA